MNYLAHALLSGNDTGLILGNFIADHIKGNKVSGLPDSIARGVAMHRAIDSFTDSHTDFREAKRFFYRGFERYSGVLVDLYFDHLLGLSFQDHCDTPLAAFGKERYRLYESHAHVFPESAQRFLQYMVDKDLYQTYATEKGLEQVLRHLSQRIGHGISLQDSFPLYHKSRKELYILFTSFFNDAKKFAEEIALELRH